MSPRLPKFGIPGMLIPPSCRLPSYAIISARMSRMGYQSRGCQRSEIVSTGGGGLEGDASAETYLWHCLIVDGNQVSGLWVDFQALVERQSSLNRSRWVSAQGLTLGHLLQKVRLFLLNACGEALLLGLFNNLLDDLALLLGLSFGVYLSLSNLSPLVTPQLSSELGLAASCVVEVDSVG